ncbi:MAG: hypothetical protein NC087_01130 [Anaeroplasma bactoclasticum]|nr:hypothetical protein [Anaeroplasma bactoclasticum]
MKYDSYSEVKEKLKQIGNQIFGYDTDTDNHLHIYKAEFEFACEMVGAIAGMDIYNSSETKVPISLIQCLQIYDSIEQSKSKFETSLVSDERLKKWVNKTFEIVRTIYKTKTANDEDNAETLKIEKHSRIKYWVVKILDIASTILLLIFAGCWIIEPEGNWEAITVAISGGVKIVFEVLQLFPKKKQEKLKDKIQFYNYEKNALLEFEKNLNEQKIELEAKISKTSEIQSENEKLQSENNYLNSENKKLQSENNYLNSENEKLQNAIAAKKKKYCKVCNWKFDNSDLQNETCSICGNIINIADTDISTAQRKLKNYSIFDERGQYKVNPNVSKPHPQYVFIDQKNYNSMIENDKKLFLEQSELIYTIIISNEIVPPVNLKFVPSSHFGKIYIQNGQKRIVIYDGINMNQIIGNEEIENA